MKFFQLKYKRWGIGERMWGGDFKRRMMMFESIIESMLM
jgi:hypothetical protein